MLAKGQTVIQWIEQFAPKHFAMPNDPIGLQVGTLQKEVRKVLITLDVTLEVVEEAVREQADLIIAHHPVIFNPLKNLITDTPAGHLYEKLIKHDIAVYAAHTNLDVTEGGVNDMLANAIGLQQLTHLEDVHTEKLNKLVVFVPQTHQQQVLDAIFRAGAGWIGDYSHCSFNIEGTGTFLPREGANPFIGQQGKLERTAEIRIETIVPQSIQRKVIQAMLKSHPYEEVAYDLYPMDLKGRSFGLGRVGKLSSVVSFQQFARHVKAALNLTHIQAVTGSMERTIKKAAVIGGKGAKYWRAAQFAGADVLVTGDVDFHTAQDALAAGMAMIDIGHYAESIMKEHVASRMREKAAENKSDTQFAASQINTDPFQHL